jgi:arylmalonate decarboxylase
MPTSRRDFLKLAGAGAGAAALALGSDPVLGMIFPPTNYPIPPEATQLYPHGIRFIGEGVGLERMTPAGYDAVIDKIVPAAEHLAHQGANAISLMGPSLSFYKGAKFNQQLADSIHKATGLPSTTMSTAIIEGLKAVGARRVSVATAYNDVVNERLRIFLEESGIQIVGIKGLNIERFEDSPPVTHDSLLKFSAEAFESMPKADSLLISCGNLKTLELVVPLEARCKVPVVSSMPHALWASVRLLGLTGQAKGFGTLLAKG